jgi:putative ABC transport system substrate-binding protein
MWPFAARVQQPTTPLIGFLGSGSPELSAERLLAFRTGLGETGYVEGRNVKVEYRWAEGQYDRLPAPATDLVHRQGTVLATAANNPAALAAKSATTTIPIVFLVGIDPVKTGLVSSPSRPGGNLTGLFVPSVELGPKRLEVLHEVLPMARTVALLVNPLSPFAELETKDIQVTARSLGLQIQVLRASTESEIDASFETLVHQRAGGLIVGSDHVFGIRSEQLVALAARHAVPAIHQFRDFARAGGLMSYGPTNNTGRILKFEKPAHIPVEQSTKVELTVNLKTAKALGVTISPSLLARADEVIE